MIGKQLLAAAAVALCVAGSAAASPPAKPNVQKALDELVAAGAPGAVAVVRDGNRTLRLTSGYGDLETKAPIRATDRFRIGSLTKTFVAATVLRLVEDGKLTLGDSVEHWLPGAVPNGRSITVRRLLNQTSGLFDYYNDSRALKPYLSGNLGYVSKPRQLVEIATSHAPLFAPGTKWSYSNTNYVVLGLIVEAATGKPLAQALRSEVFAPLGLHATSFDTTQQVEGAHAHGYMPVGKPPLTDVTTFSPTLTWAAGAIVSTADDVARFYRELLAGRLLRPDLLRAMETTVPSGPPDGEGYGLGLGRSRLPFTPTSHLACGSAWGHGGAVPGYTSYAWSSRSGARQFVLLVNLDVDALSAKLREGLARFAAAAYCGS